MKSKTCISRKTGQPLSVFYSLEEAESSALYEKSVRGWNAYPYLCDKCGFFHLAPEENRINVIKNACNCRDSKGNHKALYLSMDDAEIQRCKSEREQHVRLKIYRCGEGKGFHLTHLI